MSDVLITRRDLIAGAVGVAIVGAVGGAAKASAGALPPIRPPGGQNESHFIGACIRCNRCRGVCPRDVIVSSDLEEGIINLRTPRLHFRTKMALSYRREEGMDQAAILADPYPSLLAATGEGFCDFCMLCVLNCPTGALTSFDPQTEWIGEAVIEPASCIAFEKLGGCRRCVDYCPFAAITLDENRYPVVDPALCNGCGICENICPSSTYRTYKGEIKRGINIEVTGEIRPL